MIFSKTEGLEDRIIALTLKERITIKALHAKLAADGNLSLRAIYKATDKLIEAGVLIRAGKRVMVSEEWAKGVAERLLTTPMPAPSLGERVSYTFTLIEHLDAFWKTMVLPIEEAAPSPEVFFYNPHNFWAYMPERKESEEAYYRHFGEARRHGFFTVGGDFEGDREFKRDYQSEFLQVDARDVGSFSRRDHLTLIGPLIITVRLPKGTAGRIDELYASGRSVKDMLVELLTICRSPGKIRFILENNPSKAAKIRRVLAKNFYFKI